MHKRLLFLTLLKATLFANTVFCQNSLVKKGNEQYDKFEYINAQKTYLKAVKKGYQSADLYEKLANCYYFNSQFKDAARWYTELIITYPDQIKAEYYFRYAQTLKSTGRYQEADIYMGKFIESNPNDYRAYLYKRNKDYLKKIEGQSHRCTITNLPLNSPYSDFGTAFFGQQLIFSSSRAKGKSHDDVHQWNKEPYLDLYIAVPDPNNNQLFKVKKWDNIFNGFFHESTPVFTKDMKTVYFTRNSEKGSKENVNNHVITTDKLQIFRSRMNKRGKWGKPKPLPFNNNLYSTAHPALNARENKLYFSSDMPGGFGGPDLYEVDINPDGSFGTPRNLGNKINTEGKETFPFISQNDDLYFASDGHVGLGGLDIYVTSLKNNIPGEENIILNLGKPINSPADDFAFIIDVKNNSGYFSSNRSEGKGKDDIYSFVDFDPLKKGDDLAKILDLNPIYFDLDKSFIRPDAARELDKVINIMKQYPNIKIDIRSHTDSRASHYYNIKLSERRARSTRNYIVNKGGIDQKRLTWRGYGETQLLNHCSDGVYCNEDDHQLNRRSEFIIIEQ
ncbi:OmpA family protein [Abyssalbus ytuae]|uniref:OmpA family protein n=1 Tax=Abyssalbus ytuae TaxID=2926907 RepID=A0A9E7D149_9FLAO|nr:OmpA family protein [Abyssalbus ytuae]UOB16688.1 OmpA family protein [Abyssalbus ytuae]